MCVCERERERRIGVVLDLGDGRVEVKLIWKIHRDRGLIMETRIVMVLFMK